MTGADFSSVQEEQTLTGSAAALELRPYIRQRSVLLWMFVVHVFQCTRCFLWSVKQESKSHHL